jgi:hypothetical protein
MSTFFAAPSLRGSDSHSQGKEAAYEPTPMVFFVCSRDDDDMHDDMHVVGG